LLMLLGIGALAVAVIVIVPMIVAAISDSINLSDVAPCIGVGLLIIFVVGGIVAEVNLHRRR